jgi:hypothetical protein
MLSAPCLLGADFVLVGTHPTSALTPYPALNALSAYEGRVYMGYGDWNQYPVAVVVSYDPAANAFRVEYSAPTDSLDHLRSVGGKLYAPSMDPSTTRGFAIIPSASPASGGVLRRAASCMSSMWLP